MEENKLKWYTNKFRRHLCDMHIDDWSDEFLKDFSPENYYELLKKVNEQGAETLDVQFLTAFDAYRPNIVKEQVVTQETTKLPITYDSIALFVILGIIVILVIAVFLRMKKLSKQNEEK